MSKPLELSGTVYQVLDQNVHRYSSTTVSGGGSDMHGNIQNIQSSVSHHSDQEIWVQDLINGRQRKFEFRSFNIDVLPGHRLVAVWDKARDKLERIVNLDTDIKSHANGLYNHWDTDHAFLHNPKYRVANAIFLSLLFVIPFLGWLGAALMGLSSLFSGGVFNGDKKLRHPFNRPMGLLMILIAASHGAVFLTVMSPGSDVFRALEGSFVSQHWQLYVALVIHYITLPGAFLYEAAIALNLSGPSSFVLWLSHSLGLVIQSTILIWISNRINGRVLIEKSRQVDQFAKELEEKHAGLLNNPGA